MTQSYIHQNPSEALSHLLQNAKGERRAWVVFTNQTDLPWLRALRAGYRHCFIVIHDGAHWISIDPMAHYMDVIVHHVPADFDMPRWLEGRGHKVVSAPLTQELSRAAPVMLFTCVEACKRILGVHKRAILTPWQLYCHLTQGDAARSPFKERMKAYIRPVFKNKLFQKIYRKGEISWEV